MPEWFMPRPLGALEMKGPALMPWLESLPPLDPAVAAEAHRIIADAMAS